MPGNVANTAPATVFPASLSRAFTASREWAVSENRYRNAESQRTAHTATSRKRFVLSKRLTADEMATLRAFWEARKGSLQPFYFYHPWETSPLFSHDPTGAETAGRYTVRFAGDWSQVSDMGRGEVTVDLIELA